MTAVTTQESESFWRRARLGIFELVAMIALTVSLVVAAASESGSSNRPDSPPVGVGRSAGTPTVCVPHGAGRTC